MPTPGFGLDILAGASGAQPASGGSPGGGGYVQTSRQLDSGPIAFAVSSPFQVGGRGNSQTADASATASKTPASEASNSILLYVGIGLGVLAILIAVLRR